MSGLLDYFEERPPACSAVEVWFHTVEKIADYFCTAEFETTLTRRPGYVRLQVKRAADARHQAIDLDVVIDQSVDGFSEQRMYLVRYPYVDPVTAEFRLVPASEFESKWRLADPMPWRPSK